MSGDVLRSRLPGDTARDARSAKVDSDATSEDDVDAKENRRLEKEKELLLAEKPRSWPAWLLFAACVSLLLLVTFPFASLHGGASVPRLPEVLLLRLRWVLAFLVSVPFLLTVSVSSRLGRRWDAARREYWLQLGARPPPRALKGDEAERDEVRWRTDGESAQTTWEYEKERFVRALLRLDPNMLMFGGLGTLALTGCAIVLTLPESQRQWGTGVGMLGSETVTNLMISVAAAASAGFLIKFAGVMVRISDEDINTRMFAWAARSLALVIVADIGLFLVLESMFTSATRALLLGLFTAGTGDHALKVLLAKAANALGTEAPPAEGPSPLLALEGMTAAHVNRLEEEGILSIQDLAFVPTARLFFSTPYSLQQICDWQDRALLWVYLGAQGVASLAQQMKIVGALDLQATAHAIRFEEKSDAIGARKTTLGKALGLDEGGLETLIESITHDSAVRRLEQYWLSVVKPVSPSIPATPAADATPGSILVVEAVVRERE